MDVERLLAEREWLQRLALRLLGDGQDAEDLVQETMRAALESAPVGLDQGRLRAWLTTVARRTSFFGWRSDANRRAREREVARTETSPSTDAAMERASTRQFLVDTVMALDEPLRSAVVLRYFEGLSYDEVALRQGVTQVAARKRVSRGVELLRTRLDHRSGGDRAAWMAALAPIAVSARAKVIKGSGVIGMQTKTNWMVAAVMVLLGAIGVLGWSVWGGSADREVDGSVVSRVAELAALEPKANAEDVAGVQNGRTAEVLTDEDGEASDGPAARAAFPPRPWIATGTLEVRVSWGSDGSAAQDVSIKLMPWGDGDPFLWQQSGTTDDAGLVVFEDVHPGTVTLYADRGGAGRADVEAGRTTRHDVVLDTGFDVEGHVLDPEGRPVGGAVIQLSDHGNTGKGVSIGTANAAGSYHVRGLTGYRRLSARATGHAASSQTLVLANEGTTIQLDLVLGGPGGRVRGRVIDENGTPLRGARVRIAAVPSGDGQTRVDGRWVHPEPLPAELRTDEAGVFHAGGLAPIAHTIEVRTSIHAPLTEAVVIVAGREHALDLQMELGGVLTGVVTRKGGVPATGARVLVGTYGQLASHQARAGRDGSFRIEGIAAGEVDVRVEEDGFGKASGRVTIAADVVEHWVVELMSGSAATGVLVDEDGNPLPRWAVSARGRNPSALHAYAFTDGEGRFELEDIPEIAIDLHFRPPGDVMSVTSHVLAGVLPASETLRVVIPSVDLPSGTVSGLIRDVSGEIDGETSIALSQGDRGRWRTERPDSDGRIHIEGVYAGVWNVTVSAPGRATWGGMVEVPPGGNGDLGEVVLGEGGFVRLVLRGDGAGEMTLPEEYTFARLDAAGMEFGAGRVPGGEARFGPLPPGPVILRVRGQGWASMDFDVTVQAGETVDVDFDPAAGVSWPVEVQWPGEAPGENARDSREVGYRVTDARGNTVRAVQPRRLGGTLLMIAGLRDGRYDVEAWDLFGRTGNAAIEVDGRSVPPTGTATATITMGD